MTKITVTLDDQSVETFEFDTDTQSIGLGRRPANDVCITDRSVSGRHARIEHDGDALWIEDLGSTNGTYVNGRPVERQRLSIDDDILLGAIRVRCELPVQASAAARPMDQSLDDSFNESFKEVHCSAMDEDDELDESMRAALALYSDDPAPAPAASDPALRDEDDDIDFSEDARLFAQSAGRDEPAVESAGYIDDDRLPTADNAPQSDEPQTLTDRAKVALGREAQRPRLRAVNGHASDTPDASESRSKQPSAGSRSPESGNRSAQTSSATTPRREERHQKAIHRDARPLADNGDNTGPTHDLEPSRARSRGAVIEIKNGAKSGQILPIDKPVTTLGRPGIQIAAIMRKPDGYFLMHIESDDSVERPTLNADSIGDEPVLLHSGDALNVAGIDVEFMLS